MAAVFKPITNGRLLMKEIWTRKDVHHGTQQTFLAANLSVDSIKIFHFISANNFYPKRHNKSLSLSLTSAILMEGIKWFSKTIKRE